MKVLSTAMILMARLTTWGAGLVETQTSQFGGGAYQQLSLDGVQQYCGKVLDAARYPNTLRLETVNREFGAVAQPDGSLRFVGVNPAVVANTPPNIQMAIRDTINSCLRVLELGTAANPPPSSYEVGARCRNSLRWLSMAVSPRDIQRTGPVEIDPNPMNSLPPGWEKSIEKAELHTQPDGWRELHERQMRELPDSGRTGSGN